jgi:DNA polymerase III subunit gamma/tau
MAIRLLIAAACVAVFATAYSVGRPSAEGAAKAEPPSIEVVEEAAYEPPRLGDAASLPAIAPKPRPPRPARVQAVQAPVTPSVEPVEPEPSTVTPVEEPVPVVPQEDYVPPPQPTPPPVQEPAPEPDVLTFDDSG